jgi:MscS family membrane protein
MDFLDNIYLNNTVRAYCIVGGSIILMLVLKRYLSHYIASILFRLTHNLWKDVDKKSFTDLVVEPLEWFLLISISVFAIDKLNFPADWQYRIYGHPTDEILSKIGIGIIIISFTWFLLRIIDFIAMVLEKRGTHENRSTQLIIFFRDFLKIILAIIGLLLLIKACFNQPVGSLLTSLSIVGAVLALAAKESLENLIASFIIFFDKPFSTGDTLKVNAVTGKVERIGLRSTRIRTADKTLVTVPNKQMVDSVVDNWSLRTHRRSEIKLELAGNTSSEKIKQVIEDIKKFLGQKSESILSNTVFLSEINKSGVLITAEYFTQHQTMDEFNILKQEVAFFLKKMMEENEIEMAAGGNTLTIINEPKSGE